MSDSAATKLDIIREEPCGDESPHEAHVFSYGPMHYQCPGERGVPAGTPAGPDSESGSCHATGEGALVELRSLPGAKRDRLACWLCNQILNRLATPWYRKMVGGSIRYGLLAAAKDEAREAEGGSA